MSQYLVRLRCILTLLKAEPNDISGIMAFLESKNIRLSNRQLNRDLNALQYILEAGEELKHFYDSGHKYFYIYTSKDLDIAKTKTDAAEFHHTHFYKQTITDEIQINIKKIKKAISQRTSLTIQLIKDDETGDNLDLDTLDVKLCPIKIIYHRSSYYLAAYDRKLKEVGIFGLRQLKTISLGKSFRNYDDLLVEVENELKNRFGVTKNINDSIYDIEIKFTPVLGRFIENHQWHHSQKIKKVKDFHIMYLRCGINRELMGWLFQWMYNAKVIKPKLLKQLYIKTLKESQHVIKDKKPFVYRNVFTDK